MTDHPKPPPFFKNYADLSNCPPPPKPLEGEHIVFGEPSDTKLLQPSLKDFNQTQLYDDKTDPVEELKKLNHSLMFKFLELTNRLLIEPTLITNPQEDFHTLNVNVQHLLNEFRQVQAREMVVQYLQNQIKSRRKTIEDLKKQSASHQTELNEILKKFETDRNVQLASLNTALQSDSAMAVDNQNDNNHAVTDDFEKFDKNTTTLSKEEAIAKQVEWDASVERKFKEINF